MRDEPFFEMILHVPGQEPLHIREAIEKVDQHDLLDRIDRPLDVTSGEAAWREYHDRRNRRDDLAAHFGDGMAQRLVRAHNERIGGDE